MTEYAYIIALLPLLSFIMIIFFLRWKEKLSAGFAIGGMVTAWVMSVIVLIENIASHGGKYENGYHFIDFLGFTPEIGFIVDPLAAVMLVVVTTVSTCVHIYSMGYMHGDPRYSRFFSYLSLFTFSMLGLVISNNFFLTFIFWELVGLTSYLLIGFWFEKVSAANACKKAFITTRVGDLGFLVGLMVIAAYCGGSFNYGTVFDTAAGGTIPAAILTLAAVGVFAGAVGKSAQFPLHVWLPDAMEGPTPVSALVHSATMVAAGVYLVARAMPLFVTSADASLVVAIIGLVTSFMAATIALVQNDIKRILAYSTCSQLGYMIMALGLYGWETANGLHSPGFYAGTFHLMTHAFFKALLFLGAGSVIHAVHTNDIQEMGGLLHKMGKTGWTFIIASLSIAGIFPLAGFWSKDEIVAASSHNTIFFIGTLLIAFMTAFYMFRLVFLTFFGKPRNQEKYDHAHESPSSMTSPLLFLSILAIGAGWVGLPWFEHGFAAYVYTGDEPYHVHANYFLMGLSLVVALGGIGLAYYVYFLKKVDVVAMGEKFKPIYKLLYNKYYFDEIYEAVILNPIMVSTRFFWKFDAGIVDGLVNGTAWFTMVLVKIKHWIDRWIVDGAVNGAGWIVTFGARIGRHLQTGKMQFYVLFSVAVAVVFILSKIEMVVIDNSVPYVALLFAVLLTGLAIFARSLRGKSQPSGETESEE